MFAGYIILLLIFFFKWRSFFYFLLFSMQALPHDTTIIRALHILVYKNKICRSSFLRFRQRNGVNVFNHCSLFFPLKTCNTSINEDYNAVSWLEISRIIQLVIDVKFTSYILKSVLLQIVMCCQTSISRYPFSLFWLIRVFHIYLFVK